MIGRRRRSRSPGRSSSGAGRTRSPRSTRTGSRASSRHELRPRRSPRYQPVAPPTRRDQRPRSARSAASRICRRRRRELPPRRHATGEAIGRIVIKRLGLNDGASSTAPTTATLEERARPRSAARTCRAGPARSTSRATGRPTSRRSRTSTHIRDGDVIPLEMPYATFVYRAFRHRIVARDRPLACCSSPTHEVLELQACHPRFFATHRYLVVREARLGASARRDAVSRRAHRRVLGARDGSTQRARPPRARRRRAARARARPPARRATIMCDS